MTAVRMFPVEYDHQRTLRPGAGAGRQACRAVTVHPSTRRLYRKRRLTALAVAGVFMAVSAVVGVQISSRVGSLVSSSSAHQAPAATGGPEVLPEALRVNTAGAYVVKAGDTLWSIARRIQPSGDVRPLVEELARRNGGPGIQAGQVVELGDLLDR